MVEEILKILKERDNWLILSHEKPDGDTIGCGVALASLGLRLSKKVVFGCPDPCSPRYSFLLKDITFEVLDILPIDFPGDDGVIICVDTSNASRSVQGIADRSVKCPVINIDHHIDNEKYGDVNWIVPDASATGELVTELLFRSPWGISADEATALYAAVISDNGSFSFASTTLKSHDCAMKLLEAGASPNKIAEELDANLSDGVLKLWGAAMLRTETFAEGRCALYWLSCEDFAKTGTTRQSTENLVNFLLRIKGVKLAALCSEISDPLGKQPEVRVSLRARSLYNAREVASVFGGGGHNLAAGCTIKFPLEKALSLLRTEMESQVAGISAVR
jgi:phosphoesterase RecJ-like protein